MLRPRHLVILLALGVAVGFEVRAEGGLQRGPRAADGRSAGSGPVASQGDSWALLTLEPGQALHLATGAVVPAPAAAEPRDPSSREDPLPDPGDEESSPEQPLLWSVDGALLTSLPVQVLGGGERAAPTGGWTRPEAAALALPRKLPANSGQQISFDLEGGAWGVLRILAADREAVELEWMRADAGQDALTRDPERVAVDGLPDGHRLAWTRPSAGASYRVSRRALGAGGPFTPLGETADGTWLAEAEPGAPWEYRVERAAAEGEASSPGALAVGLRQAVPADLPLTLEPGMRLDLLSGEVDGARAHLEVTQVHPTSAFVLPLEGVSLQRGGKPGAPPSWTPYLPSPARPEARSAQTGLAPGTDLVVRTPEGLFVRLLAEPGPDGSIRVQRQVDLARTGVFPVPPDAPALVQVEGGWTLAFEPLPFGVPEPGSVHILLEREVRAGVWEEWARGESGERELAGLELPGTEGLPFVRLRARHEVTSGARSLPGDAFLHLLIAAEDSEARAAAAQAALEGLVGPGYAERQGARALLEALGPDALPAVQRALGSGSIEGSGRRAPTDATLTSTLRDLLAAGTFGAAGQGLLLEVLGREAGLEGPPPAGLLASSPDARALGALRELGRPESAPWLRVLEASEGDPLVQALLATVAAGGGPPAPWTPPLALGGGSEAGPFDWRAVVREGAPRDVAARLRAELLRAQDQGPDQARAWVLLLLANLLEGVTPAEEVEAFETVELVLRLLEREPELAAPALLEVVRGLANGSGAALRASRELLALRTQALLVSSEQASGAAAVDRVELGPEEVEVLRLLLTASSSPDDAPLEVVLAPGEYDLSSEGTLTIQRRRVRVRGAGLPASDLRASDLPASGSAPASGTRILASLRADGVDALELVDLELRSDSGVTLWLQDTSAGLARARVLGRQKALQLAGSTVDLAQVELAGTSDAPVPGLVWVGSASAMRAMGSRLVGDTIYLEEGAEVLLDRCVVQGGARSLFQGRAGTSRASVVDSLLRVPGGCMQGTGQLTLERSALDAGTAALSPQVRVALCRESVRLLGGSSAAWARAAEDACALGEHATGARSGR